MTAYYVRFIPNYAAISVHLNFLKRKDVQFKWGIEQAAAFDQLKQALTKTPTLKLPNFQKEFVLHTDASINALGAVLSQSYNDQLFPIAFASRTTNKHEKSYDTLEFETLGIIYAFEKFRVYLEHREFKLYTDNSALTWLLSHPKQVGKIARLITTINSFQFTIEHVKGRDNVVVDCLSRLFEEANEQATIQPVSPTPVTPSSQQNKQTVNILFRLPDAFRDLKEHQQADPEIVQTMKAVKAKRADDTFSIRDGV